MARRMMSNQEIKDRTPIFQNKAWEQRKEAIEMRVKNRMSK
jgi:hypothetical protein